MKRDYRTSSDYEKEIYQIMLNNYDFNKPIHEPKSYFVNGSLKGEISNVNSITVIGNIDKEAIINDVKKITQIDPDSGTEVVMRVLKREAQKSWRKADEQLSGNDDSGLNPAMVLLRAFCICLRQFDSLDKNEFINACNVLINISKDIRKKSESKDSKP
ncbi:MAG: hypothetical protein PUE12_01700 [Oscillospiraceae bacterium]|nr:hypothetical protein [Oscillospiraceae bacterium]